MLDKVEELTPGRLIDRILEHLYGEDPPQGVPKQVLVPMEPDDVASYEEWLTLQRRSAGADPGAPARRPAGRCSRRSRATPSEEFNRHRLRRASDHNTRSRALNELQEHLDLPEAPLRIECYDMAHLQGTDYVGSMVVLQDGLPDKREYRRFKVHVPGNDDYAAMEEVLTRRLTAYLADQATARRRAGARRRSSAIRRSCCSSTAARASWAWPSGSCAGSGWTTRSPSPGWPSASSRSSCPGGPTRSTSRGGARRCSCSSASATRPTASPTRSTVSGAASG